MPFHNVTVTAPCRAEPFLARCYGSSWAEEAVVWGHSARGRVLHKVPLAEYCAAAEAVGYATPVAAATSAGSLEAFALTCPGELREHLWASLGWASPYLLECAGQEAEDPQVLEMLELESRHLKVPTEALSAVKSVSALLELLHERSGAFLEPLAG